MELDRAPSVAAGPDVAGFSSPPVSPFPTGRLNFGVQPAASAFRAGWSSPAVPPAADMGADRHLRRQKREPPSFARLAKVYGRPTLGMTEPEKLRLAQAAADSHQGSKAAHPLWKLSRPEVKALERPSWDNHISSAKQVGSMRPRESAILIEADRGES